MNAIRGSLLAVLLLSGSAWLNAAETRGLEIYWVDVEGGGATLIVTPARESILIDSGNPGLRDAKRIHKVATEVAGLKQIDFLVTTHFHTDHFGGAAELAQMMPIRNVYDNGIPARDPDGNRDSAFFLQKIKPYREFTGATRHVLRPGTQLPVKQADQGSPVGVRCIAARQQFIEAGAKGATNALCREALEKPVDTSDNANSVVLVVELGPFRFLDGGDLTWNTEGSLVCPVNRAGQVDVYQVNHHGLDVSNNPLLIRSLAPTVTVMNNGSRKGAEAQTVAALLAAPSVKARYQVHKNVRANAQNSAPDEQIANVAEACEANHLKLSVDSSGRTYTVSVPSSGHRREFATVPKN